MEEGKGGRKGGGGEGGRRERGGEGGKEGGGGGGGGEGEKGGGEGGRVREKRLGKKKGKERGRESNIVSATTAGTYCLKLHAYIYTVLCPHGVLMTCKYMWVGEGKRKCEEYNYHYYSIPHCVYVSSKSTHL